MRAARRQRGAALIALAALITIAALTAILTLVTNALGQGGTNRLKNAETLQLAKTALLGYVARQALELGNPTPGRLPCPESPGDAGDPAQEGVAASDCAPTYAVQKTVGRLPWRTLGIDKLYDTASEPLWYAVSQNWVYSGGYPVINPGTAGSLSVDGVGDVVAILIAPGAPLRVDPTGDQVTAGCTMRVQARADRSHVATATVAPDYRDYLECENATSPIDATFGTTVKDNATNPVLNDQVVYITAKDVMTAIQGPVAERMQKTVAPLLNEYADLWITGRKMLPYAAAFRRPEEGIAVDSHCGPAAAAQTLEGLLPVGPSSGACVGDWSGSVTGAGFTSLGCSNTATTGTCSFRYYRLTALGQFLLGIAGLPTITGTLDANAAHAAASFRDKITAAQVTPSANVSVSNLTLAPTTTGDVSLSLQLQVTSTNLCMDGLLPGLVCSTLTAFGLATSQVASVQIPHLPSPTLTGSQLSAAARAGAPASFDFLAPPSSAPHYWFMQNQWYRYAYYAVAPDATVAGSGGNLTVTGFPSQFGSTTDKRFVLALMGPAVTGQSRGSTAALNQYVEGANAITGTSPRTFAYQVFDQPGNDRIVTCPFVTSAATVCN